MPELFSPYDKVSRKKRLSSRTDFVEKCEEIMQKLIIGN
jgi:hypothetical protein